MTSAVLVVALLAVEPAGASVPVAHRRVLAADGYALALYRYGHATRARPVLLVPELGMSRAAFDFESSGLARYLALRGRQVFVAELRGQGSAGVPLKGAPLASVPADLSAVVAAIGAARVDLVVHGWSGTLALAATSRELKGRVGRVVALATPAEAAVPSPVVEAMLKGGGRFSQLGTDAENVRLFELLFAFGGRFAPGRLEGLRARAFGDLGPVASSDLLGWMRSGDLALADGSTVRARLAEYDRPTLLFLGLADGFANPELASPLRELVKGQVTLRTFSRFEMVTEDYSHLSMLHGQGAPRDIFEPALAFLDRADEP